MRTIVFIGIGLLLGSWFLLGEKKSPVEKLITLIVLVSIYVGFRLLNGASMDEILAPLLSSPDENY